MAAPALTVRRLHRAAALAALVALAAGAGCQRDLRRTVAAIDASFAAGRYDEASRRAERAVADNGNDRQDLLLWWLEAGRARQAAGDTTASARWYALAIDDVRPYLDSKAEATVSEALATTAVNQTIRIYRATPPERIMLCALQGANLLSQGDLVGARIDLNRAHDFQQDAVARFAREVNAAQEATNKEWASKGWNAAASSDALGRVRAEQGRDQAQLGMAAFANPFASYLRAAFLIAAGADAGDRQNARADLRAVQEMVPGLACAAADIALVDVGAPAADTAVTWVFLLSGLAPDYREFRLDIPIPVGNVNYVSAAFPVLRSRGDFVAGFAAAGEGGARSERIADIDAAVRAEFDARLPLIVTQEIISSAGKAAATWAASQAAYAQNNTAGVLVQLAGIAYQASSTAADLRAWTTMPREVSLLRVPTPASGRLDLARDDGSALCTLEPRPGAPNIALVTVPATAAAPAVLMYRGGASTAAPQPAAPNAPPAQ